MTAADDHRRPAAGTAAHPGTPLTGRGVRVGVLDVGSNSANLHVIDAYPGSPPLPVYRQKMPTRLAEEIRTDGAVGAAGVERLVAAVCAALDAARAYDVTELIPYATSAVRDAANREQIVAAVRAEAGIDIGFLSGEEEARLTYFAVHRWYGWSAGPLLVLDIGGGSMEIMQGRDEDPALAVSLPLGAGRLTRSHLREHPADRRELKRLRNHIRTVLRPAVQRVSLEGRSYKAVATSKTFTQLARFAGTLDGGARVLTRRRLRTWIPRLAAMSPAERAALPGVPRARARQILAGAVVAETTMAALDVDRVTICPWALREGVLLRRLAPLPVPTTLRQARPVEPVSTVDGRRSVSRQAMRVVRADD